MGINHRYTNKEESKERFLYLPWALSEFKIFGYILTMMKNNSNSQNQVMRDVVLGTSVTKPPIWIMRQAGRYLPEYRELRKGVSGFLELCYTPEKALEVTLQPLRRFDLDAAILFSDILVIPDALGQKVWFVTGEGPRLEEWSEEVLNRLSVERILDHLEPVLQTVKLIRAEVPGHKSLIGFCGAPWTVATYMIGGRGSSDQAAARLFALQHPVQFSRLMDILVEASATYLIAQFEAGVDILQIFESWASNLDELAFENYVIGPNRRIVEKVREVYPEAPIIGFPRGAPSSMRNFAEHVGVNMIGVDYSTRASFAHSILPAGFGVQGNLDPLRLVAGGQQMRDEVEKILIAFEERPHVFNLGHGIVPQTPIAHVEELVTFIKTGSWS